MTELKDSQKRLEEEMCAVLKETMLPFFQNIISLSIKEVERAFVHSGECDQCLGSLIDRVGAFILTNRGL